MAKENKSIYVILAVISDEPKSGYDIKKFIEGSISNFWNISYGQIYPTLNKLVESEYVTYTIERNEGRPERKVYSITESGMNILKDWLVAKVDNSNSEGNELLLKLFFGRYISIEDNINHVVQYKNRLMNYLEKLDGIREELEGEVKINKNIGYEIITVRQGQIYAKSMLEWCDETIKRLKNISDIS